MACKDMRVEWLEPTQLTTPISGNILYVAQPLSFWGGVNATTGLITDTGCDVCGQSVAGSILCLPALRGSSSTSAVLLELAYRKLAPQAILLADVDAILALGILVAREMDWLPPALGRITTKDMARLSQVEHATLTTSGRLCANTFAPHGADQQ